MTKNLDSEGLQSIVDDYDFIPHVKQATDEFIAKNKKYILNTNHISSFRGTMIIEYKNAY